MGIHGIFKEIGPGQRLSLIKLSSDHLIKHDRPFRLAIDTSIWLFQILASKGGSNPALRTFYYRLLRLLSLNIHPLFVFDGPNKPTFKRNKKVGGPGVRVASVPEFLAKQLLKHFGFPWHVAPGEAEAECALLQREGLVDAVLSEDVDTLMFGSGVTLKNWSAEGTSKVPTHVNIYRAQETKEKSGLDREGMILVALMSGGDYITEGIPGCGPKLACDAARAGFGRDLCDVARRKDKEGLIAWRERLQHQIVTNESKFFSRKNTKLVIPNDFPNQEVLGYYTHPCISAPDKVERLRQSLRWDQEIDFAALRSFAADAFDWRCLGGAKKFIRNLAPAMLVREMRLRSEEPPLSQEAQAERENDFILAIHGTRTHRTTDAELEYRMSYIPMHLVPIDLSVEDEDDDYIPAGGVEESEAESEFAALPNSTADEDEAPASPTKKRVMKPYHPDQPEKIWMMHSFLKLGCPLTVEDYEASMRDPKEFFKARRKARAVTARDGNIHAKKTSRKREKDDLSQIPISAFGTVVKSSQPERQVVSSQEHRSPYQAKKSGVNARLKAAKSFEDDTHDAVAQVSGFAMLSTQFSPTLQNQIDALTDEENTPKASRQTFPKVNSDRPFLAFATRTTTRLAPEPKALRSKELTDPQRTPQRRKRPSGEVASPAMSQRTISSYFTPSPRKSSLQSDVINLISPSPAKPTPPGARTPLPPRSTAQLGSDLLDFAASAEYSPGKLPDTVTKRRKKAPLRRHQTAPVRGVDEVVPLPTPTWRPSTPDILDFGTTDADHSTIEVMDLASPWSARPVQRSISPEKDIVSPNLTKSGSRREDSSQTSVVEKDMPPPATVVAKKNGAKAEASGPTSSSLQDKLVRRSLRQEELKKKRIQIRASLEGSWREVEAETLDMTHDGTGWKQSKGRAKISGWRKSGVEVLDLTGA